MKLQPVYNFEDRKEILFISGAVQRTSVTPRLCTFHKIRASDRKQVFHTSSQNSYSSTTKEGKRSLQSVGENHQKVLKNELLDSEMLIKVF